MLDQGSALRYIVVIVVPGVRCCYGVIHEVCWLLVLSTPQEHPKPTQSGRERTGKNDVREMVKCTTTIVTPTPIIRYSSFRHHWRAAQY